MEFTVMHQNIYFQKGIASIAFTVKHKDIQNDDDELEIQGALCLFLAGSVIRRCVNLLKK